MASAILPTQEHKDFFNKDSEEKAAANVDVSVRRLVVTIPNEANVVTVVEVTTAVDGQYLYVPFLIIHNLLMGVLHPHTPASLYRMRRPPMLMRVSVGP